MAATGLKTITWSWLRSPALTSGHGTNNEAEFEALIRALGTKAD
ncbi:MAG TPA: hypothetical protein VK530_21385 [Candidatus Acidoferrum sp.]|nr:hypothetical protein [Candidatus Acidoferrum sp.]